MIDFPDGRQQQAKMVSFLDFGQTPAPSQQTVVYVNAPQQQLPPSQALPALVSLFLPGFGQLIQGRILAWILWQIGWLISLCCCFIGIGFVTTPILIIANVIDAATYNPYKNSQQNQTSTGLKCLMAGGGCLLVIVVLFIMLMIAGATISSTSRIQKEQPDDALIVQNAEDPIYISADELMQEYVDNKVATDWKYKGKTLIVDGTISSLGNDIFGGAPYVKLKTNHVIATVHFSFQEKDKETLASLQKGQSICIRAS